MSNKQTKPKTTRKKPTKVSEIPLLPRTSDNLVDGINSNIINLNINNSDEFNPDYLYCWSLFNKKPVKDSFFSFFDTKLFFDWIEEFQLPPENITCNKEIISDIGIYIINSKFLIQISNTVYISLTQFTEIYKNDHQEELDDDKIGAINIYSKSFEDRELVEIIKNKLFEFEITFDDDEENDKSKESGLRILKYDNIDNKFLSIPIDVKPDIDLDHMDLYYNDDTFKQVKKLIKKITKNNKGLTLLHGERGCGKTSILTYIANKINKKVIFVPNNIIEHTLYNAEFIEFLKYNMNSVIIYDDCDNQITSKVNPNSISNILGLTDGLLSNLFNCNIILSYNHSLSLVDKDLIESNNLIDIIELCELTKDKVSKLSDYLEIKDIKMSSKLVNVVKERKFLTTKKIGFQ